MVDLVPTEIKVKIGNTNKRYAVFFNARALRMLEERVGKPFLIFAQELFAYFDSVAKLRADNEIELMLALTERQDILLQIGNQLSVKNCVDLLVSGLNGWRYDEYRRGQRVGPEYGDDEAYLIIDNVGGVHEAMAPVMKAFLEVVFSRRHLEEAKSMIDKKAQESGEATPEEQNPTSPQTENEPTGI